MAKTFYTEHEIEDLFKSGITRLDINDDVVLTGLAYEKAVKLGMQLVKEPEIPVKKPFLTDHSASPAAQYTGSPLRQTAEHHGQCPHCAQSKPADLHARIKAAVVAKLGTGIDQAMLDSIISRILAQLKV